MLLSNGATLEGEIPEAKSASGQFITLAYTREQPFTKKLDPVPFAAPFELTIAVSQLNGLRLTHPESYHAELHAAQWEELLCYKQCC